MKAYLLLVFSTVSVLGMRMSYAQDTITPSTVIEENISPIVQQRDRLYESPSLLPYQRYFSYSDLSLSFQKSDQGRYLQQEGSGYNLLHVDARSYRKKNTRTTLWGEAYYNNRKTFATKYNESLDYALIYPYVMADSVGGDLQAESYYFSGGLAKKIEQYTYGVQGSYKGSQSYRSRDPRPNNISSEAQLQLSAARNITSKYLLGADLGGTYYRQDNKLSFVNELGNPFLFHDAGLGVYNEFVAAKTLSGNNANAYFKGLGWHAKLNFVPKDHHGFAFNLAHRSFYFNKAISNIKYDIAKVDNRITEAGLAYLGKNGHKSYMAEINISTSRRSGREARFNNQDTEAAVAVLSEDIRYVEEIQFIRFNFQYGLTKQKSSYFMGAFANWQNASQQYVNPQREMHYQNFQYGLQALTQGKAKKFILEASIKGWIQQNLSHEKMWIDLSPNAGIYDMLHNNFNFLTSSNKHLSGNVKTYLPISINTFIYIQGNYTHTSYEQGVSGNSYGISCGFIF